MHASRHAIILAFALSTIIACEDPFTNRAPAGSPGVVVPGVSDLCPFSFGCSAWSADSKTLYVVVGVGSLGFGSLIAVDPATLTSRVVGPIDAPTFLLEPTADGAAMYFAALDREPQGQAVIKRMSLSDGSTTTVAKTNQPNFVVSPDGTTLAYHAASSTLSTDTIAVLDLRSGTRRATTIEGFTTVAAFSADGTQLSIIPNGSRAIHIWHLATGARDTIPANRANSFLFAVAWSGGSFRMLFHTFIGAMTFTDTSLAGGSALTFAMAQDAGPFQWLPNRSAMWTVPSSPICGPQDCSLRRYDFIFATATNALTVGSTNSVGFLLIDASPDGHWVAHAEGPGALYLLHHTTP